MHSNNRLRPFRRALLPLCVAALGLGAAVTAQAAPAYPGLIEATQPDGTKISIRVCGDEAFSYILSADGKLLTFSDGAYYYAVPGADGLPVASSELAAPLTRAASSDLPDEAAQAMIAASYKAAKNNGLAARFSRAVTPQAEAKNDHGLGLFQDTYPRTGKQKGLVILVSFSNRDFFMQGDPYDYFYRLLNEEGFSDYGHNGSARDFFIQQSHGLFTPDFDVYGPVKLPKPYNYYGAQVGSVNDAHPGEMIAEACIQLDDQINFADYDADGDGFVDNVFVFYAGLGQASSSDPNTVWPHQWSIKDSGYAPPMLDGVTVNKYACTNEYSTIQARPDAIGTFVHEFSHVLGLPDLYVTNYAQNCFTPDTWSTLDRGPYNNEGRTPPAYSIFERNALGWMTPKEFTTGRVELRDIKETNEGYIVKTKNPNEFFLFENRQQYDWDAYVPGHGMLVWHIDYNDMAWKSNSVNNEAKHQYVDIVEGDGMEGGLRADDTFPGKSGWNVEFTPDGDPAFVDWDGNSCGVSITNIEETDDGVITFDVVVEGAGIDGINAGLDGVKVSGRTVAAGEYPAEVFDTLGRMVGCVAAGASFDIPEAGIYIVRSNNASAKYVIR